MGGGCKDGNRYLMDITLNHNTTEPFILRAVMMEFRCKATVILQLWTRNSDANYTLVDLISLEPVNGIGIEVVRVCFGNLMV